METNKSITLPVTLKGADNYLLWARTTKAVLNGRKVFHHVEPEEDKGEVKVGEKTDESWFSEDQSVLAALQSSLAITVLEAYSYCESAKELWDTLKNVFGNVSNLTRVFEIKRSINQLSQGEVDFNTFFGKFRSSWAELEMLRPPSLDAAVLNERREQDKVFSLLMVLNPAYNDLVKHILRGTTC